jgi:uncharacterized SAM-binding protein YcdF (DUF218 family)
VTVSILKTISGLILVLIVAAGFYFQLEIKQRFPAYDPTLLATGAIFVAGMIYAVMERNIIIALVVLLATIAVPFLMQWVIIYWPY